MTELSYQSMDIIASYICTESIWILALSQINKRWRDAIFHWCPELWESIKEELFFQFCQLGLESFVQRCLSQQAFCFSRGLCLSVFHGHLHIVKLFHKELGDSILDQRGPYTGQQGNTPLIEACKRAQFDIVKYLVDSRVVNINAQHCRTTNRQYFEHDYDIKLRPNESPNDHNSGGLTPIMLAASDKSTVNCRYPKHEERTKIINYLLIAGADTTIKGYNDETFLYSLTEGDQHTFVDIILDGYTDSVGLQLDLEQGGESYTPLQWAAENGSVRVAAILLARGANPLIASYKGDAIEVANRVATRGPWFGNQADADMIQAAQEGASLISRMLIGYSERYTEGDKQSTS